MQGLAINEIEGAVTRRRKTQHLRCQCVTPFTANPAVTQCLCGARESYIFNDGIDAQGQVRLTLDREKTAEILYKTMAPITASWQEWEHEKSRSEFYKLTDALNANLKDLITVVKEGK